MFCPNCNSKIDDFARICPACGCITDGNYQKQTTYYEETYNYSENEMQHADAANCDVYDDDDEEDDFYDISDSNVDSAQNGRYVPYRPPVTYQKSKPSGGNKPIIIGGIIIAIIVIVAGILIANLSSSNDSVSSDYSDSTTSSSTTQTVKVCEQCGSRSSVKSYIGTIFPDNNFHSLCDSCYRDMN